MPRKARRRPWGSITEVVKGKKYILRWVQNTSDGRKRKSKTFYGTFSDADRELTRIRFDIIDDKPTMTIGNVIERWYIPWLDKQLANGAIKKNTHTSYMFYVNNTVLPRWGETPVDSISPVEVQEWLDGLSKGEGSISMVVLKKAMDFPTKYEITQSNKFRIEYDMPTRKSRTKRTSTFDLKKADEMFAKVKDTIIEPAVILSLFGSARPGESLGVTAGEVSLVARNGIKVAVVPIVRRSGVYCGNVLPDGDLKTPQSNRITVIPEPYGTRLADIASGMKDDDLLVTMPDGRAMGCWMLRWYWSEAAGDDHIPYSNLRTSWRTFAQFEWGIDFDTCEVLMGHQIPGVSGHHYIKPTTDQLVDAVTSKMALRIS